MKWKEPKNFEILDKNDIFIEKVMFWLRTKWLSSDIYEKLNIEKIDYFIGEWLLEKRYNKSDSPFLVITDNWVLLMDYILKEIL